MSIKELLNKNDRFAAQAGCQITEVDNNHAIAVMTVTNAHLNGGNVCQGGALFTLADLAIAALMNHGGQLTFGIQNSIMFVSSAMEGDVLTAEATCVCDHHKIPSMEVIRYPLWRCASPIKKDDLSATLQAWDIASRLRFLFNELVRSQLF